MQLAIICACAPALKPLLHQPIASITSKISSICSKSSSARSPSASRNVQEQQGSGSETRSSIWKFPFRRRDTSAKDSVWDGDEEYGMLRLDSQHPEKDGVTSVSIMPGNRDDDAITPWPTRLPSRKGALTPTRAPTLEIMKRQSIEQEVSYLTNQDSRSPEGMREPILPDP